jgi:hypothetical protein
VRTRRADFERGENGLNFTRTSVRNRVIIFGGMDRGTRRCGGDEMGRLLRPVSVLKVLKGVCEHSICTLLVGLH